MSLLFRNGLILMGSMVVSLAMADDVKQADHPQSHVFDYSTITKSRQIPMCMVGDSITWYDKGDWWRKWLLRQLPNLAFVGTHSGVLGYSHAGEGGNSTGAVLARMNAIPDCPYYHVLIGTNNNNIKIPDQIPERAEQTAGEIIRIVQELLKKKNVEKVFLASILPCSTENPLRDQCNSATNALLRKNFDDVFPDGKVVWIEYETPIRNTPGWEQNIALHPNEKGYELIAGLTVEAISSALGVKSGTETERSEKTGIVVDNLMGENLITICQIVAGWYVLSCELNSITAPNPEIVLEGQNAEDSRFRQVIPIHGVTGEKISVNIFTNYEGYGYTRDFLTLKANGCTVSNVLLEKLRPSQKPSIYGAGSYLDTLSPVSPGELLEASHE